MCVEKSRSDLPHAFGQGEKEMKKAILNTLVLISLFVFVVPVYAAAARKPAKTEDLKQYMDDLKKNPRDNSVREKIIKMVSQMKKAPALSEEAERHMARGAAFAQRATEKTGYAKAISEFEAATNEAPWLALAYYNLGVVQEMAGLFSEAIESLKLYLLAEPDAKNARDVKNKIYALEAEAEAVQAGMNAPEETPEAPADNDQLSLAGGPALEIEQDAALRIIKLPKEKKARMPNFAGSWYFKEKIRNEDVTIHAFEIVKNKDSDLTIVPPKRAADSVATVQLFEVNDRKLKLRMKWKMKSVVGYWKTETYDLTLSDDDAKLSGLHNQKSVGGRNIDLDRVLFRQ